jgi:general secretion pathway protein G
MKLSTTRRASRRAAFTLLEVLVVVAILVILASVGVVATTRYLEDARKSQAQLQCKGLSQAAEAYMIHPANTGGAQPTLQDLATPSFGTSFLKNGQADLNSPWPTSSATYILEFRTARDGITLIPFVYITAPDGTQISQYGIGNNAQPPQQ